MSDQDKIEVIQQFIKWLRYERYEGKGFVYLCDSLGDSDYPESGPEFLDDRQIAALPGQFVAYQQQG